MECPNLPVIICHKVSSNMHDSQNVHHITSEKKPDQMADHECYAMHLLYDANIVYGFDWELCNCGRSRVRLRLRNNPGSWTPRCQFCTELVYMYNDTEQYLWCTSCVRLQHRECKPRHGYHSSLTSKFHAYLKKELFSLPNTNPNDIIRESNYLCHQCSPATFMTKPFEFDIDQGRFLATNNYRKPFIMD